MRLRVLFQPKIFQQNKERNAIKIILFIAIINWFLTFRIMNCMCNVCVLIASDWSTFLRTCLISPSSYCLIHISKRLRWLFYGVIFILSKKNWLNFFFFLLLILEALSLCLKSCKWDRGAILDCYGWLLEMTLILTSMSMSHYLECFAKD